MSLHYFGNHEPRKWVFSVMLENDIASACYIFDTHQTTYRERHILIDREIEPASTQTDSRKQTNIDRQTDRNNYDRHIATREKQCLHGAVCEWVSGTSRQRPPPTCTRNFHWLPTSTPGIGPKWLVGTRVHILLRPTHAMPYIEYINQFTNILIMGEHRDFKFRLIIAIRSWTTTNQPW